MSTALARITGATKDLDPIQAMIAAETEGEELGFDLKPIKVTIAPGGLGVYNFGEGDTRKTFNAIVVYAGKRRGYWPVQGADNTPPLCSSPDGARGFFSLDPADGQYQAALSAQDEGITPHPAILAIESGDIPAEFYWCASCTMNQWGSAHQKKGGSRKGKGCKEMRQLILLVHGMSIPVMLSLPPMSLDIWDAYCTRLYADRLREFAVWTKFSQDVVKGGDNPYGVVKVERGDAITDPGMMREILDLRKQIAPIAQAQQMSVQDADPDAGGEPIETGKGKVDHSIPF